MKLCNFPFSYSCRINFLCFNISPIPFSLFFSLLFPPLTSPFLPTSFFLSVFAFLSTPNFLSVPISYYIFSDLYSPFFFFLSLLSFLIPRASLPISSFIPPFLPSLKLFRPHLLLNKCIQIKEQSPLCRCTNTRGWGTLIVICGPFIGVVSHYTIFFSNGGRICVPNVPKVIILVMLLFLLILLLPDKVPLVCFPVSSSTLPPPSPIHT